VTSAGPDVVASSLCPPATLREQLEVVAAVSGDPLLNPYLTALLAMATRWVDGPDQLHVQLLDDATRSTPAPRPRPAVGRSGWRAGWSGSSVRVTFTLIAVGPHVPGERQLLHRQAVMPYAGVPRVGDMVGPYLTSSDLEEVDSVVWDADGSVELFLGEDVRRSLEELIAAGFVPPPGQEAARHRQPDR
jgi:hypothetical protein